MFHTLWVASIFVIICIITAIALAIAALLSVVVFFTYGGTIMMRKAMMLAQALCAFALTWALFFLMVVGGSIQNQVLLPGMLGTTYAEGSSSFSWGTIILACTTGWAWALPCWTLCGAKLRYCKDYYREGEEDESDDLISRRKHGRGQMTPDEYERAVRTKGVIDYYAR